MIRKKYKQILTFFMMLTFLVGSFNVAYAKEDSSFWVEYIDVGQGDCALIQCDEHYMMIDGGPSDASSIVYTILKNKDIKNIDLMIATHPDADHIGGLSGALNYSQIETIISPVKTHDTKTFNSLVKYVNKQGKDFTMPYYGDEYKIGSAEVKILGPIYDNAESNNLSIVTKVTYGENTFLFMGDAEEEEEGDILRKKVDLSCDVLKVGHHGSNSSTSKAFLDSASPKYAVISVGSENTYGHPTQETINKLADAKAEIYRTDLQGDITITSDGKNLSISTEKNASNSDIKKGKDYTAKGAVAEVQKEKPQTVEQPAQAAGASYVLNKNTKKFHYPSCSSVGDMSPKNRADVSATRDEIIAQGYVPCKRCKP